MRLTWRSGAFGTLYSLMWPLSDIEPERPVFLPPSSDTVVSFLPVLLEAWFLRPPLPLPLPLPLPCLLFSLGSRLTSRYSRHVATVCPAFERSDMYVAAGSGFRPGAGAYFASAFAPASDFPDS